MFCIHLIFSEPKTLYWMLLLLLLNIQKLSNTELQNKEIPDFNSFKDALCWDWNINKAKKEIAQKGE